MIKTFIASDAEKAQAKARQAMGHKVIILNIRDLPSGDVEVTAGDEDGAQQYRQDNPNPVTPTINPDFSHDHHREPRPSFDQKKTRSDKIDEQRSGPFGFFSKKVNKNKNIKNIPEVTSSENASNQQYTKETSHFSHTRADESLEKNPENRLEDSLEKHPLSPVRNSDHIPSDQKNYPPDTEEQRVPTPIPRVNQHYNEEANSGSRLHETLEQRSTENSLSQLRERLTGQKDQAADHHFDDPAFTSLISILRGHGISNRLMTMILNGAHKTKVDDDLYSLGVGIAESFNFSPLKSTATVPIMLVGPTGAGKTSCAAKLSALALNEGENAMMITTDVGRAGALEQFATYSDKLNIECYAAETPEQITTIMKEAQPQGAVILDTPGISPYDAGDLAALKSYQTAIGAEPVLVLPASGDVNEFTDWAHAFRAFGVRSCIITKFDATRRVGAGISAAFEGNMTLTYFSETPFISDGLLSASPEFLAYRLTANYPGRIVQN